MPGSVVGTGLSESVAVVCGAGQDLQLVAAFVDATGQVVTPPAGVTQVEFQVEQTSSFTGCAMNAGTSIGPDFSVVGGPVATFTGNVATIGLRSLDYGGFTVARVVTSSLQTATIRIPKDDGEGGGTTGNWLPDMGWYTPLGHADDVGASGDDVDSIPSASGPPVGGSDGDGLSQFEEYRGFVIQGVHIRTRPSTKDVFFTSNMAQGIGFTYTTPPFDGHRIIGEDDPLPPEHEIGTRVINLNSTNSQPGGSNIPSTSQRAIRIVRVDVGWAAGLFGCKYSVEYPDQNQCFEPGNAPPRIPNEVNRVEVYPNTISEELSLFQPPFTTEQIDNEIRRTIGHEVGHAIHICHRPGVCSDGADVGTAPSIMSQEATGTPAVDPRSQYNSFDTAQIRLRP